MRARASPGHAFVLVAAEQIGPARRPRSTEGDPVAVASQEPAGLGRIALPEEKRQDSDDLFHPFTEPRSATGAAASPPPS